MFENMGWLQNIGLHVPEHRAACSGHVPEHGVACSGHVPEHGVACSGHVPEHGAACSGHVLEHWVACSRTLDGMFQNIGWHVREHRMAPEHRIACSRTLGGMFWNIGRKRWRSRNIVLVFSSSHATESNFAKRSVFILTEHNTKQLGKTAQ